MSIFKTKTVKGGKNTDIDVEERFYLNQLPDAMEKMGWEMAPKLMRHWFNSKPAYSFTEKTKDLYTRTGNSVDIPKEQVNDSIVKMAWAINYIQVRERVEELHYMWDSPNGIQLLRKKLSMSKDKRIGYTDSAIELDTYAQVNSRLIGSMQDTIDDYYGAIGKANIKLAVRGYVEKRNYKDVFITELVGVYLKDSYDFITKGEFLGVWHKNGVLSKAKTLAYMGIYERMGWRELSGEYSGTVPIFNGDFKMWQEKRNEGSDFIVFSDVLWMKPLPKHSIFHL
ncbi:hypothetical protein Xmau_02414 [Xenorhabdus mauleonii]|uniref:Uncharacterized protein n=1 Tax=Xenorhabdus mauleonii TaxID=351675 RepID=A0A1I3RD53_9GAMM|nr:DUF6402 family protein [Xenorhabdus mauleonii]PHM39814.1 hypothetical protein Xmau_02414 [Xenorhabdus mauleonii]SFJ43291.1 hypothetical protein SAMN05421680_10949 [Xenorhabdus mauleonii]